MEPRRKADEANPDCGSVRLAAIGHKLRRAPYAELYATGSGFFVANKWVDRDQDGRLDYNEWVGRNKSDYRPYEDIVFVAEIRRPVGSRGSWRLYAPDGSVVRSGSIT